MRTLKRLRRRIHPLAPAAVCGPLAVYALADDTLSTALAGVACIGLALSLLHWWFGRRYHHGTYRLALRTHARLRDLLDDVDNDTILVHVDAGAQFIVERKYGVTHVTRMRADEIDPRSGVALVEFFTISSAPIVYRSVGGGTLTRDEHGASTISIRSAPNHTGFWKDFLFSMRTGTGVATTDEMTALLEQLAHAETVGEHGE